MTATLASYWAAKGWETIIVTVAGQNQDFYPLHPAVRRIPLGLDGASRGRLEGIVNNLRRMRTLRGVLAKEKPAVAIAFMPTANVLLSLATVGLSIATIGSERTYPPKMPLGRFWERARRYTYGHLTSLVAQTDLSAQWLVENTAVQRDRVVVIPNPVTLPMPDNEPRLSLADSRQNMNCSRILLSVGRLGPEKGFDRLIEAFAKLSGQHSEWGLVIIGEGEERAALEEQCRAAELERRVSFPGAVGNIGECYQAADLYVLTSHFEGFPNTLIEAMAHGLPAVAVDCETGPSEILRHELDGLLVPQNDQQALVTALELLMGDSDLRASFGARAVESRERFAVERVAGQWEELFEKLARKGKAED